MTTGAGWAGATAGGMLGAQIGAPGGPWGIAIGAILGALGGGIGGNILMDNMMGGKSPEVHDAIMRSDGTVQRFRKDDLVAVGTNLDARRKGADMIPAGDIMKQSMNYTKDKYEPLNMRGSGSNMPQTVKFDISGVLEIKGEKETAYLTSLDLKNIGLTRLTALILNETDRYKNHGSGKKLASEIITPI
jgi:hypothetical protein